MRVLIITSCTGEKTLDHEKAPLLADFQKGAEHIEQIHQQLDSLFTLAKDLYSGQQHVRLMRGIEYSHTLDKPMDIDLYIVSAGYGLVTGDKKLPPYEVTFSGMKKSELRKWADHLHIPEDFRKAVEQPYDLALILLGDNYLAACDLDANLQLGGPTLFFCGSLQAKKFPIIDKAKIIPLKNSDAKTFSCGLVGLKGELAYRVLRRLTDNEITVEKLFAYNTDVLTELTHTSSKIAKTKISKKIENSTADSTIIEKTSVNPEADKIISIPDVWYNQSHRKKMRFFIPEWDDRVEPDFVFEGDSKPHGSSSWHNTVYAHQIYDTPNYDGILVSKVVAEKGEHKKQMVNELGIHRYLRVPREFPVFGDCGAFDYIMADDPPFNTDEMLDYYNRLDFDYGVSLDHLILDSSDIEKRNYRYELTINNARDFIEGHKKLGCKWTPVGAVQGWDPESYANAAKKIVDMGYSYIALGGLVRSKTPVIIDMLKAVRKVIPAEIDIHIFGVARPEAIPLFVKYGVTSADSASHLRTAWLGSTKNFLTPNGWYSAIRIPQTEGSYRAKKLVDDGDISLQALQNLEQNCLGGIREYGKKNIPLSEGLIKHLSEYDALVSPTRKNSLERIKKTLIKIKPSTQIDSDTWYIDWIKPQTPKKFAQTREKTLASGDITSEQLIRLEIKCLTELQSFLHNKIDKSEEPSPHLLNLLFEYEYIVLGYRANSKSRIRETLEARPWDDPDCAVCKGAGVETIIFRGNNRNRRRGFHNNFIFYQMFKERVNNPDKYLEETKQQSLFD